MPDGVKVVESKLGELRERKSKLEARKQQLNQALRKVESQLSEVNSQIVAGEQWLQENHRR